MALTGLIFLHSSLLTFCFSPNKVLLTIFISPELAESKNN